MLMYNKLQMGKQDFTFLTNRTDLLLSILCNDVLHELFQKKNLLF